MNDHVLGQLVSYMRAYSLKYGFLSTYRYTVFVRRSDKYRFDLSQPLNERVTSPSIRECFAGLCAIATNDRTFEEYDFNETLVSPLASNQSSQKLIV
jgi:hypothetical protein